MQIADGRKKLSEIKTGEKFAFEGRFFMGVEVFYDGDYSTIHVTPVDLETGKYGFDGEGGHCDPDTLVTPCSWERFKMTFKEGIVQTGMMACGPITTEGVEDDAVMHDVGFAYDDLKPPEMDKLIDPADISFQPTYEPEPPKIDQGYYLKSFPMLWRDFFESHCETICHPFWWFLLMFVVVLIICVICEIRG